MCYSIHIKKWSLCWLVIVYSTPCRHVQMSSDATSMERIVTISLQFVVVAVCFFQNTVVPCLLINGAGIYFCWCFCSHVQISFKHFESWNPKLSALNLISILYSAFCAILELGDILMTNLSNSSMSNFRKQLPHDLLYKGKSPYPCTCSLKSFYPCHLYNVYALVITPRCTHAT